MFLDAILSWFSPDIGMVVTGRQVLLRRHDNTGEVTVLDAVVEAKRPDLPKAHLPEEVRDGLTTKKHLAEDRPLVPLITHGLINNQIDMAALLKRELKPMGLASLGGVKPRVVVTAGFETSATLKKQWLDVLEQAGARRIYLVQYGMACAVGMGLDVIGEKVHGLLAMESDWSEFVVVSYADTLVSVNLPYGTDDLVNDVAWELDALGIGYDSRETVLAWLREPEISDEVRLAMDSSLRRLINPIREAINDTLRDIHHRRLSQQPLIVCGEGAALQSLRESLSEGLGLSVELCNEDVHPAISGVHVYVKHLHQYKQTMGSEVERL